MKRSLVSMSVYVTVILCLASLAWSIDKEEETKRINNAATVLSEIMTTPDKGIPDSVMKNAKLGVHFASVLPLVSFFFVLFSDISVDSSLTSQSVSLNLSSKNEGRIAIFGIRTQTIS